MGSCFAQHMADKFEYFQFQYLANPMGVIFHPMPLIDLIERALVRQPFTENELFYDGRQWACYQVHSSLSGPDQAQVVAYLNNQMLQLSSALSEASHLVLTFGSAWGYKKDKQVVANCHKMPGKEFEKVLTDTMQLRDRLINAIGRLKDFNPDLNIILTVSPVRHIKDGMVQNAQSKARLIDMVHGATMQFEGVDYFPAYEIVMDELRDYRFYKVDMIHPSQQAVDYIWDRFQATWIHPDAIPLQTRVNSIRARQAHRPLFPDSPEHKEFIELLQSDIQSLQRQFPHINL